MLIEKISNRPLSGKPTKLRPLTGKPKISFRNSNIDSKNYNNFQNTNNLKNKILNQNSDKNDIKEIMDSNNIKDQTIIKKENSKSFINGIDKDSILSYFLYIQKNDNLDEKREKLKNINLIESDYEDLYEWSNLVNGPRPMSRHLTLNKKKLNNKNEENKIDEFNRNVNKNIKQNLKHTILEYDNNKKKLNFNKNKHNLHSRPISVFSQRNNSSLSSFYLSKTINDNYKGNLKTVSSKANSINPKLKSNSYQLKNEIKKQRILSSKKEKQIKKRLSSEQINFDKQKLFIAGQRKNSLPFLESIFGEIYPGKEVIKDHIKMYFNTMKPFNSKAESDDDFIMVDYTKNDRARWKKEMKRIKMKKKLKNSKSDLDNYNYIYNNNYNINEKKNLVLSYYNQNDPYIKLFNKIIDKKNNINNNEKNNLSENYFNPILQKFDDNFNKKKLIINDDIDNMKNYIEKIEEKLEEKKINNNIQNIKSKTGITMPNLNINNPLGKRPQTSIINKKNIKDNSDVNKENNDDSNLNLEYIPSNSFPLKTLSNVGNSSYDKINQRLKKRKFEAIQLKHDYFITNIEFMNKYKKCNTLKYNEEQTYIPKRKKYKKALSLNQIHNPKRNIKKENNKWKENDKYNNKINYYNFDCMIDGLFNKNNKKDDLHMLNYFENIGNKIYSYSNNVKVTQKGNYRIKKLNHIYSSKGYSKDNLEKDFVDEMKSLN